MLAKSILYTLSLAAQALMAHAVPAEVDVRATIDDRATLATCAGQGPGIVDANSVHVTFYGDLGCCNPIQTTNMGVLNECHQSVAGFQSWRQSVGQNLFGRNIKIHAYTDFSCTQGDQEISLTNADVCDFVTDGQLHHSFQIRVG